ncbi:MAG: arylsulfatase [Planctomycetaceae bacterium]|nr:arylsulfatase [Planctomycetales bacterium]MCB9925752.1 arylsulfatase [Planctomycetaceae bacterium]
MCLFLLAVIHATVDFAALADNYIARPNVIFIMADDLGWGDVGYHGSNIETPNIDRLAERGVHLDQFYVQPVCSPTRASLMTGRYPIRYGLQCGVVRPWAEHGLPLDEQMLTTALCDAGYVTAICGKWHLGHIAPAYLPTRRGFLHQYGHYNGALDYFTHERDGGHDWHRNDKAVYEQGYTTDLLGREAAHVLATHDKSKPLFLYVPFNAPHTPLQAPDETIAKYKGMKNQQRRVYAAMVDRMDQAVGTIVSALKQHDFPAERTLIFFCSDNGGIPSLGSNRELRDGKGSLYEGGVRVPAIAVWDGVLTPSKHTNEALHIVDIYPTVLSLAGIEVNQKRPLDGRNAWATIAEGKPSPHEYILHNVTPFHGAIRVGDWKLIHNGSISANATSAAENETWELFNIRQDISEKQDLRQQEPEIFKRLQQQLGRLSEAAVSANIPPNQAPAGFRVPKVWGEQD